MSDERIESLLNDVKQIIKTHEEHVNKQGENFNIFSILRMERKEVETHSRFIYELLNPKGRHGQGSIFLKSFAKNVINSNVSKTAIKPQREDLTDKNRRIDFTLETDENIIGIEMKIDAGDQKNQLFDYQEELEKRTNNKKKGTKLFYLTLFGSEASERSLNGITDYSCISFENEIQEWINDCIQQSAEKSVLREALIQYKILIEKLTGKNMDENKEIASKIMNDANSFKAALKLEKALIEAKIQLQIKFWEDLLSELGGDFQFGTDRGKEKNIKTKCGDFYKKSKNNTHYGIVYKNSDSELMLIVYNNIFFRIKDENNKGKEEIKKDINKESRGWFYSKIAEQKLNFGTFDDNLIDALSGEQRKITIKKLATEFNEIINELNKGKNK